MSGSSLVPLSVAHPWLLLAILLLVVFLFHRKGGVRIARGNFAGETSARTKWRRRLPSIAFGIAVIAAALGAAGLHGTPTERMVREFPASRIIVMQDQSGSMFGEGYGHPLRCIFRTERDAFERDPIPTDDAPPQSDEPIERARLYNKWTAAWSLALLPGNPRIRGSCEAIEALLDELDRRKTGGGAARHLVSYARFAETAALHTPFTSDYRRLRASIAEMDWSKSFSAIGGSTNINDAFYVMLASALRRNLEGENGHVKIPGEVANALLGTILNNGGRTEDVDDFLAQTPELVAALSRELEDTTFILITDAENTGMWYERPSLARMLRIAHLFHIGAFVISTEADDAKFRELLPQTGSAGRPGEFFLLNKAEGYSSLADVMKTIFNRTFARSTVRIALDEQSYVAWCALIAFIAAFLGFLFEISPLGRTIN